VNVREKDQFESSDVDIKLFQGKLKMVMVPVNFVSTSLRVTDNQSILLRAAEIIGFEEETNVQHLRKLHTGWYTNEIMQRSKYQCNT